MIVDLFRYETEPTKGDILVTTGSWSAVLPWPLIGIHAALLPDGRVLTFGSDENGEQGAPQDLRYLGSQDRGAPHHDRRNCDRRVLLGRDPRPDHRQYDYHWR